MQLKFEFNPYLPHPVNQIRKKEDHYVVVSGIENKAYPRHFAYVNANNFRHYVNNKESWQPMPKIKKL